MNELRWTISENGLETEFTIDVKQGLISNFKFQALIDYLY